MENETKKQIWFRFYNEAENKYLGNILYVDARMDVELQFVPKFFKAFYWEDQEA